jgi:hypothetical protein
MCYNINRKVGEQQMLLCNLIDLDVEKESIVLKNARETIEYLQNVVMAIEQRVLSGEQVKGVKVVEGQRRRIITSNGIKYLENLLGRDAVIKVIEKPIGITELEKLVTPEEINAMYGKGVIAYESGKPKVVVEE